MTTPDRGNAPGLTDLGLDRPHSARMYDYYLNGKDNYAVDRKTAEEALQGWPAARSAARANRSYMHRAVHELARAGFRQFLDIGTGIPTRPNLHEVAQSLRPDARIVYADNDPIVLTHARALLDSTPEGRTAYVEGDITRPESILKAPELAQTLDLTQPVFLSINAVLHFVPDRMGPYGIVDQLLEALPSGSALSMSHVTEDVDPEGVGRIISLYNENGVPAQARTRDEVTRFFTGLDMQDPGVVMAHKWRSDVVVPVPEGETARPAGTPTDGEVSLWAGVGIKP